MRHPFIRLYFGGALLADSPIGECTPKESGPNSAEQSEHWCRGQERNRAMAESSFARLFRGSQWAHMNPCRIYTSSPIEPPSKPILAPDVTLSKSSLMNSTQSSRPAHYGFKKDLPPTFHGKPLGPIMMRRQDGEFGQVEFVEAQQEAGWHEKLQELRRCMRDGIQVPGRVLNTSKHEGWLMGVGGFTAFLRSTEIPDGFRFSWQDTAQRRAYWVWIVSMSEGLNGRPHIHVSLKKPSIKSI